jgi:hypothetical protein
MRRRCMGSLSRRVYRLSQLSLLYTGNVFIIFADAVNLV